MEAQHKLVERIQASVAELKQKLAEGKGESLLHLLEVVGKFHQYSYYNQILIFTQCPYATLVAGMKRWNKMGRRVKKGQKGIAILAPSIRKVEVEDPATQEVQAVERLVGFHHAYVFDLSQTEGKPVVQTRQLPQGPALYQSLRSVCPVPVVETGLGLGHLGYTDGKQIVISDAMCLTSRAETLLHEWAHVELGHVAERKGVWTEELEAEAVAYAVGRELGLQMQRSRDYILGWSGTVEKLEDSLGRILQVARKILTAVGDVAVKQAA